MNNENRRRELYDYAVKSVARMEREITTLHSNHGFERIQKYLGTPAQNWSEKCLEFLYDKKIIADKYPLYWDNLPRLLGGVKDIQSADVDDEYESVVREFFETYEKNFMRAVKLALLETFPVIS